MKVKSAKSKERKSSTSSSVSHVPESREAIRKPSVNSTLAFSTPDNSQEISLPSGPSHKRKAISMSSSTVNRTALSDVFEEEVAPEYDLGEVEIIEINSDGVAEGELTLPADYDECGSPERDSTIVPVPKFLTQTPVVPALSIKQENEETAMSSLSGKFILVSSKELNTLQFRRGGST